MGWRSRALCVLLYWSTADGGCPDQISVSGEKISLPKTFLWFLLDSSLLLSRGLHAVVKYW